MSKAAKSREYLKANPVEGEVQDYIQEMAKAVGTTFNYAKRLYYAEGVSKECDDLKIPFESVKHGWAKTKNFSLFFKNNEISYQELRDELIEEMKKYSPTYPKIKRTQSSDPHALVIDPADIHIGKLCSAFETGEDSDNKATVQRVKDGVLGLLNKSAGFNFDKIILILGNDILHTDTPRRTTTSGTPQDTDGMWYDNFRLAKALYIWVIESLVQVAPLGIVFNPSNHDWQTGFFLIDSINSWFHKHPDIVWDIDMRHRKYTTYGENLIGTTHGDGAKISDLPLLMATECEFWSKAKHRYLYTHHVHHKTAKDFIGCTHETLRTVSGGDGWHHRKGYTGVKKAIEAFVHHPNQGQVARFTHWF